MSVPLRIRHTSHYVYDRPVKIGPHEVRLRPTFYQPVPIYDYTLTVTPQPVRLTWLTDYVQNRVARIVSTKAIDELKIDVNFRVDLHPIDPFDFFVDQDAELYPFEYQYPQELAAYLTPIEESQELRGYVGSLKMLTGTVEFVVELNQRLCRDITYQKREEQGVLACADTLKRGQGSCRDSAWLMVNILRSLGLAARFVAGYLIQLQSDEISCDNVDYHAWAEVYIPGAGWIGLDATSGMVTSEGHIPLAVGCHYDRVAPVHGTHSDANANLISTLQLFRIPERDSQASGYPCAEARATAPLTRVTTGATAN